MYIVQDKKFIPVTGVEINENDTEEISAKDLNMHHLFRFSKNWDTEEIEFKEEVPDNTPDGPRREGYVIFINGGKFYRYKNSIYYTGGFTII